MWYRFCVCLWSQAWEQELRGWGWGNVLLQYVYVFRGLFALVFFGCYFGGFLLSGSFTVPFLDQLFSFLQEIVCYVIFTKEMLKHVLLFMHFAGCICLHASGSSRLQNIYCESKG